MTPDFYYGEMLRWSFGFENPNKAAVIFACLVPLLWAGWLGGFRIRSRGWKVFALSSAAVGFLAAWACLLLTFSRGGLVGAVAGMVLVWVWDLTLGIGRFGGGWLSFFRRVKFQLSCALMGVVIAAAVFLGMDSRSVEALGDDASVGNRIELWSAALQMACENPAGSGPGRSGEEFMQWYQDVDRGEGYRTMVNSHLTFLVERGWIAFAAVMFVVGIFWAWTWPVKGERYGAWRVSFWAVLLAFLISGIFSTTMEEPLVWILPVLMVPGLVCFKVCSGSLFPSRLHLGMALGVVGMLLAVLFAFGALQSRRDGLQRTFARDMDGQRSVVAVCPKGAVVKEAALGIVPDEAVLGPEWGKLIRKLVLETGRKVWIMEDANSSHDSKEVLLVGRAVSNCPPETDGQFILLAPSPEDISLSSVAVLFLPEIDEDGRTAYWRERFENLGAGAPKVVTLFGVGTRIEWAWDQVIEELKTP